MSQHTPIPSQPDIPAKLLAAEHKSSSPCLTLAPELSPFFPVDEPAEELASWHIATGSCLLLPQSPELCPLSPVGATTEAIFPEMLSLSSLECLAEPLAMFPVTDPDFLSPPLPTTPAEALLAEQSLTAEELATGQSAAGLCPPLLLGEFLYLEEVPVSGQSAIGLRPKSPQHLTPVTFKNDPGGVDETSVSTPGSPQLWSLEAMGPSPVYPQAASENVRVIPKLPNRLDYKFGVKTMPTDFGVTPSGGSSGFLFSAAQTTLSLSGSPPLLWPAQTDCVQANEQCNGDQSCSSRYRTLRQCLGGRDRDALLSSHECKTAQEVVRDSALHLCRCRRGMKKELQCLQVYWGIRAGLADGDEFYEASPYEPVTPRLSDIFRLASINSGAESVSSKQNACLDAAKFCNVNDVCKRLRSIYISTCNSVGADKTCPRRKCHKALRIFIERLPMDLSYPLLFCPCRDGPCAERRRQTAVPACSFMRTEIPNCLEIWAGCKQDTICRSRLADFLTSCQSSAQSASGCAQDNYPACLGAYAGLIGFDVALNFLDSDPHSLAIGPWCTCNGSGIEEAQCEKYLKTFTQNRCLKNAIYAFGNGTDIGHTQTSPKTPHTTISPRAERRHILPDNQSDSNTQYEGNPNLCTSLQDMKNSSLIELSICVSESQLSTDRAPSLKMHEDNSGIPPPQASILYTIITILYSITLCP
ncbi:GDNF family receptor alpha-2 [Pelodytes ibericus]